MKFLPFLLISITFIRADVTRSVFVRNDGPTTTEPPLRAEPLVECASDLIHLDFYTSIPFEGLVYVQGRKAESRSCIGVSTWINQVNVVIPHDGCGVVKRRSSTNASQLIVSVSLILSFHPAAILTSLDRVLTIDCVHTILQNDEIEGTLDMTLTSAIPNLNGRTFSTRRPNATTLSMTTATSIASTTTSSTARATTRSSTTSSTTSGTISSSTNTTTTVRSITTPPKKTSSSTGSISIQSSSVFTFPTPTTTFTTKAVVAQNGFNCTHKFQLPRSTTTVAIGDKLRHTWECKHSDARLTTSGCLQIVACEMRSTNAQGVANDLRLVDEFGCAIDPALLPNALKVDDNEITASISHNVFALDEDTTISFRCQLVIRKKMTIQSCSQRHVQYEKMCDAARMGDRPSALLKQETTSPRVFVESRPLKILPSELTRSMDKREKIKQKARLPTSNQTISDARPSNTVDASGFYINDWAFFMMVGIFTTATILVPLALLAFCVLKKRRRNEKIYISHQQQILDAQLQYYPIYSNPTISGHSGYYQRTSSTMSDRMGSAYNLAGVQNLAPNSNSNSSSSSRHPHQSSPSDYRDRSLNRLVPQKHAYKSRY